MPPASFPSNEMARLEALKRAQILDTPLEPQYDNIVNLAAFITKAPIALISLVDKDRQWFKARLGLDACQTHRDHAFCGYVVQSGAPVLTLNATLDSRFADNPLVLESPYIRFYAGCPIMVPETDLCLGTLCVLDSSPWTEFSDDALHALSCLAKQVSELIYLNIKLSLERNTLYHFVSKVSHELRTPINGIIGMTDVLSKKIPQDDTEALESLETITASALRNLHVVKCIMDFANLHHGAISLEEKTINLRQCIEGLFPVLLMDTHATDLDIGYELPQDLEIKVDAGRLSQILLNLLSNAIKFTPKGRIRLLAYIDGELKGAEEKSRIRFEVKDTGIGIPTSKAHVLFQPFSQVDDSTTRQYEGIGLGLAVSKGLCEAMGGTMWLDSCEGEGSTFYFMIDVMARRLRTRKEFQDRKVLVLDTAPWSDSLLVKHCQSIGVQVDHSTTIDCVQDLLEHSPAAYDAILCTIDVLGSFKSFPSIKSPVLLVGSKTQLTGTKWDFCDVSASLETPLIQMDLRQKFTQLWKAPVNPAPPPLPNAQALRVAVVDDNRVNRAVLTQFLKRAGCSPDQFENGMEVVEAAALQRYDVVWMDLEMPVMDGLTATELIRKDKAATHIIAVTANSSPDIRQQCIAVGMDDFLEKPVHYADIERLLHKAQRAKARRTRCQPLGPPRHKSSISFGSQSLPTCNGESTMLSIIDSNLNDVDPSLSLPIDLPSPTIVLPSLSFAQPKPPSSKQKKLPPAVRRLFTIMPRNLNNRET